MKLLAKLGYSKNIDDLTVFDANVFSIIASEFNKLETEEMKKKSRKK